MTSVRHHTIIEYLLWLALYLLIAEVAIHRLSGEFSGFVLGFLLIFLNQMSRQFGRWETRRKCEPVIHRLIWGVR